MSIRSLLPLTLGLLIALPASAQDKTPAQPTPPKKAGDAKAEPKPAPVEAKSLELSITAAKAEVAVGGMIETTITLKNVGVDPATLPLPEEDRQLVSFEVQLGGSKVFIFEKIHKSPYDLKKDWKTGTIAPKGTETLKVNFPALAVGDFTITPHYGRKPSKNLKAVPPHVVGKPLKVRIVPAKNGAKQVAVDLRTSLGPIRLRLFAQEALGTCLHFARLIMEGGYPGGDTTKKLRRPFLKGLVFHRVIKSFMVQGGCPFGTGSGDAGYGIKGEAPKKDVNGKVPERSRHLPGRLSMAKTAHPDSGGTQFFLVTGPSSHLDGVHTVFGEVMRGLEVMHTIGEVPTAAKDKPLEDVTIDDIQIRPSVTP